MWPMDAAPLLAEFARHMREARLEAVLIGNAAAALQGAPVTTVMRPFYPASELYRVVRDQDGLQVDFMATIHGLRSFEGVRDRASTIEIGGIPVLVASLDDIIRSKRAAGRPRDMAVLEILEKAREEASKAAHPPRRGRPRE